MSRKLSLTTNGVERTCYFLERTLFVSVCLQLSSFQIHHLTFVRALHGELQANRVVSADNVVAFVVEAAVLARDGSLDAAIHLVLLHLTATYLLPAAKGTCDKNMVACPPRGVEVFLKVPQFTCPRTAFTVVLAVNRETVHQSLHVEVRSGTL